MTEESEEAKLLRLLIGYVHVMVVNNLAALRYQRTFDNLTEAEKSSLNQEVTMGAVGVAAQTRAAVVPPKAETPPAVN